MKKQLGAGILFFFFSVVCLGQRSSSILYDEWYKQMFNSELSDSTRIHLYFNYGLYKWGGNSDSLNLLPELFTNLNQKDQKRYSAVKLSLQAWYISLEKGDNEALEYFDQSQDIFNEIHDFRGDAYNRIGIGNILTNLGLYSKALKNYSKAIEIGRTLEDEAIHAAALGGLGLVYDTKLETEKAREYYLEAMDHAVRIWVDSCGDIPVLLNNLGSTYLAGDERDLALKYFKRCLSVAKKCGDKRVEAIVYRNIGYMYYQSGGNCDSAKALYHKSYALFTDIGNINNQIDLLVNLGYCYMYCFDDANIGIEYCEDALDLAKSVESESAKLGPCYCFYNIYDSQGDDAKALEYLKEIRIIEDSIDKIESDNSLEVFEIQNKMLLDSISRVEEARKLHEKHQAEIQRKNETRNYTLAGGILALLLAGGFYTRWRYVRRSKAIIESERDRSENLLLNILPEEIAHELKETGKASARDFDQVSILFTDFADFTQTAQKLTASELVEEINHCFEAFDHILEKYKIEKIKTIGDAYMAAGGLPVPGEDSVKNTVLAALEMQDFIKARSQQLMANSQPHFQMRVGIHTGPVVAGIVGIKKFQYDVWGDTVNTASRVESAGEVGKVNISQATYELLEGPSTSSGYDEGSKSRALSEAEEQLVMTSPFEFESRGKIEVKGKGEMEMYFVTRNFSEG